MSGLFGQILQGVFSGGQQGQASSISGILQQVLAVKDGDKEGVAAIISKFQTAGLGQHVQSWVGTGENTPVSAEQIGQVFSQEQLEGWAQKAGTTPDALRGVLAEALPHVIDHATPDGQVPAQMPDLSSLLGRLLGGGAGRPA
ncbi:MAG: YidB family protein [Rhodopila sp.]|nr:YidB family protein [Rhodopila sp.]